MTESPTVRSRGQTTVILQRRSKVKVTLDHRDLHKIDRFEDRFWNPWVEQVSQFEYYTLAATSLACSCATYMYFWCFIQYYICAILFRYFIKINLSICCHRFCACCVQCSCHIILHFMRFWLASGNQKSSDRSHAYVGTSRRMLSHVQRKTISY